MNAYNQLIKRLDIFIRKYYNNRLLKGAILSAGVLVFAFLVFVVAEYLGNFTPGVRSVFFFSFIAILTSVLVAYIFIPLAKLFRIGKVLSYKQASDIIKNHFPDIKDKILNALELHEKNLSGAQDNHLILAAINQKIADTEIFSFKQAVNYKENLKYLKFVLPLLLLFIGIWAFSPSVINDGSERIMNYSDVYEKPAPFRFVLLNDTLTVKKGADFEIKLQIQGDYIPDELFVDFGGNRFLMTKAKQEKSKFSYTLKNLNNSLQFQFAGDEFNSKAFEIKVLPAPVLLKFDLKAEVPAYTGEENQTLSNTGDLSVPQGTRLTWTFYTKDSDSLLFQRETAAGLTKSGDNFGYKVLAMRDISYRLILKNQYFTNEAGVDYTINVRPDLYPAISVEEIQDTANFFVHYFNGRIADDYGTKRLTFNYRVVKKGTSTDNKLIAYTSDVLPITSGITSQQFYHLFDFSALTLPDNSEIQYFFQVWDNDAVNGSKSVKSDINKFTVPSIAEVNDLKNETAENIQSKLSQAQKLSQSIREDFERMQERNLNGNVSEWENSQMLKSIMDKQQMMQELMKQATQENQSKNEMEKTFNEMQEELLKKQEELQKLMEELMTDEMKALMEDIQKLQEQFDQKQLNELLEKQELTMEDLDQKLDRNKELLKRFEVEQKLENTLDEMQKLAEEQEMLSEQTDEKKSDTQKISEEQKELEERFNEMKEEFEKAQELNEELERPMKMEDMSEDFEKIEEEFKKTQENLQNNKRSKASDSQKQNSDNMKKAGEKMESMMAGNSKSMESENLEALRQIVDNLITFSFEQEKLKNDFKQVNSKNPQYIELLEKQIGIKDEFIHIKDSLTSLAKRVPQISSKIQSESAVITDAVSQSITFFEERNAGSAMNMQQRTMTSANNLALLLSEVLDQMANADSSGEGEGSDGKPKKNGTKEGFESMKKMQEAMKKQMEQMLQQMKDGKLDQNAQNMKLAKMLAQQEILQQMMNEMRSKNSLNPETQKLLNEINKLNEQNEEDLVNKRITPELIKRQQEIQTRMLEAEKAENKRETEKKRESTEAKKKTYTSPEDFFKQNKDKNSMQEDLYRNKIMLQRFYENLNNKYSEEIYK